MHGKEWPKLDQGIPPDIAAVGTTLNVSIHVAGMAEIRNHHLPDDEQMRYVLRYSFVSRQMV